jgi:APA family basic amino acid/polyamine antiporter
LPRFDNVFFLWYKLGTHAQEANVSPDQPSDQNLPRVLGLISVVGIVVGTMIGSGIFIVPASIAADLKSPLLMLMVWVVGGVLSFFGALSLSELGAAYPHAGGMYVYLREAYGPLAAFLFGWTMFLIIDSGSMATLAVAFSSKYLPQFVDLSVVQTKLVAVLLIFVLAVVNFLGVKWGAFVQNLFTVVKLAALAMIIGVVFIFAKGSVSHFFTPAPGPAPTGMAGAFGVALVAALWACKGWEVSTFSAGETKNPEKNLLLGIFIGTLLVIFLYLGANMAYLYAFPVEVVARSSRIASDAMDFAIGPLGATFIAIAILFSITGACNGHLLTGPRVYFAMARDGVFFRKVAQLHPRFLTPHFSILAISLWSALLCFMGKFEQLFTFVVFGLWIFFGLTVGAVFILRRTKPGLRRPYRTWGYPVTPLLFLAAALFVLVNTLINKFWNSFAGLAIIILGIPAYLYWRRKSHLKIDQA